MKKNNIIKVRARVSRLSFVIHGIALTAALCTSCSDWRDGIGPDGPDATADQAADQIALTATVAASQTATRSDGSLVNRLETSLFETATRTYYTSTGEKTASYQVGVFAYHTGDKDWSKVAAPSPNLMYNQPMNIAAPVQGTNQLLYPAEAAARYWPNKGIDGNADYGKVSFWAYYPHTATITTPSSSTPLQYGINIFADKVGNGQDSIDYRMNPDANEHSDFMLSDLVTDRTRQTNPVVSDGQGGYQPTPVPLRLHHMLAQVRLYAFVRGVDRIVYVRQGGVNLKVKSISATGKIVLSNGLEGEAEVLYNNGDPIETQGEDGIVGNTYYYCNKYGQTKELEVGDSIPGDTPWLPSNLKNDKCQRWKRTDVLDLSEVRYRAAITYAMSFNNIYTQATFTPTLRDGKTTFGYETDKRLGSVSVKHYIMNPYWFRFRNKQRVMLNETYMYDYFEDTPACKGEKSDFDGIDWSSYKKDGSVVKNYLKYYTDDATGQTGMELEDPDDLRGHKGHHFNYAPGNIILAVPQQLRDQDVPNVRIDAKGDLISYEWKWKDSDSKYEYVEKETTQQGATASVTINLMQMNIKWESGYIYCYAFLEDDLQPFDEKVRGPESITTVFDPTKQTDQW